MDQSVAHAIATTVAEFGGLDVLVNCAGGYRRLATVEDITANAIAPITTLTPRVAALRTADDIERIASQVPLKRPAVPEDHAQAMLFLASDAAAYINGVALDAMVCGLVAYVQRPRAGGRVRPPSDCRLTSCRPCP